MIKETETNKEISLALDQLFVNRHDSYAVQQSDGQYYRVDAPLTLELLERHLRGELTVGVYQLSKDGMVKWLCFDIDPEHNPKPPETARKLVQTCLENKRFYPNSVWLEASRHPDPSFHVWVLFSVPVNAKVAKWLGVKVITFADVNPKQLEVFPKQTEIGSDGFGNLVKLPLGFHQVEKKWSKFLNLETFEPLPREALFDVEGVSFSEEDLEKIVQLAEAPPQVQVKLCKTVYKSSRKIRPCIIEALKTDLRGSKEHHRMRLAIATEYLAAKFPVDQICSLFESQSDYSEKRTRQQIEHAKMKEYKRFKCSTIKSLGFCIGEACPIFRRTKRVFEGAVEALQ